MQPDGSAITFDALFALGDEVDGVRPIPGAPDTDEKRLFGGLLLGQAVVAASADGRRCHSLHALFLRGGRKDERFAVAVERLRDGASFAARRVRIAQRGESLLEAFSSHHGGDSGPDYQLAMPSVAPPEELEDQRARRRRDAAEAGRAAPDYLAERLLDARPVEQGLDPARGREGRRAVWVRPRTPISGGRAVHQAAVAFASDLGLVPVGLQAHLAVGDGSWLDVTSLDHAIWFHRETTANEWLLQVQRGPVLTGGRGLARSSIFSRDGRLVASAAQEFLARTARSRNGTGDRDRSLARPVGGSR